MTRKPRIWTTRVCKMPKRSTTSISDPLTTDKLHETNQMIIQNKQTEMANNAPNSPSKSHVKSPLLLLQVTILSVNTTQGGNTVIDLTIVTNEPMSNQQNQRSSWLTVTNKTNDTTTTNEKDDKTDEQQLAKSPPPMSTPMNAKNANQSFSGRKRKLAETKDGTIPDED